MRAASVWWTYRQDVCHVMMSDRNHTEGYQYWHDAWMKKGHGLTWWTSLCCACSRLPCTGRRCWSYLSIGMWLTLWRYQCSYDVGLRPLRSHFGMPMLNAEIRRERRKILSKIYNDSGLLFSLISWLSSLSIRTKARRIRIRFQVLSY